VDRLLEHPTPVVGNDGLLVVLLVGVVASLEEVAPVVGDYVISDSRGRVRTGTSREASRMAHLASNLSKSLWSLRSSSRMSWVEGEISVGEFTVIGSENGWLWY
jgi:hypothetical protein